MVLVVVLPVALRAMTYVPRDALLVKRSEGVGLDVGRVRGEATDLHEHESEQIGGGHTMHDNLQPCFAIRSDNGFLERLPVVLDSKNSQIALWLSATPGMGSNPPASPAAPEKLMP